MDGRGRPPNDRAPLRGFTLIEVVIALMILAVSLSTLLALLSSVMQRTIRGQQEERAMMAARSVLAAIETSILTKGVDPFEGNLSDLLVRMNIQPPIPANDAPVDQDPYSQFVATLAVSPWGIATFPEALQRIQLVVSWGTSSSDRLAIDYFIPTDKDAIS